MGHSPRPGSSSAGTTWSRPGTSTLRRRTRFSEKVDELAAMQALEERPGEREDPGVRDDQLRLIFTCCHPSLATEAQVALTLRTLCGLSTEEIARAFLAPTATMAQR